MEAKARIKTPVSYYGGKQLMLKHILPVIPEHKIYVENFFGGGAVFWAKEPSKTEVINDVNMNVINFYEVLKHSYFDLRKMVEKTMHSRDLYKKAMIIYDCPWLFADNQVVRAWAFYVVTNQGFGCKIGTWGYDRNNKSRSIQNKIDAFDERLSERLKYVQVESNKAHKVLTSRDSPDTFAYIDPPYIDSDQGHYGGYSHDDFARDLDAMTNMQGKFLLSSYPSELLKEYIKKNGWKTKTFEKTLAAGNGRVLKNRKTKVEVLTANFDINE